MEMAVRHITADFGAYPPKITYKTGQNGVFTFPFHILTNTPVLGCRHSYILHHAPRQQ